MHELRARIHVNADRVITGVAPPEVPPGEHEVTITVTPSHVRRRPGKRLNVNDLPEHDLGPWPEALSLRRAGFVRRRRTVSFVDTNVLVYSTAAGSPFQERARTALV